MVSNHSNEERFITILIPKGETGTVGMIGDSGGIAPDATSPGLAERSSSAAVLSPTGARAEPIALELYTENRVVTVG